ncbi:glycosyltransferase [Sporolactobacillus sp. THM19-2]|uniref:glycosyltransferase n=1 Tax=Sporolactobacillus sp. THM19-2 TaxID=2511171 RepID=UPI0010215A83|nr:glycosyltransferase [Sporolactobacillus sp. THM19-2]RYL86666.1 hypothetical protein EWH91_13860 [Sporolactobacillus sp. THM19-2]
MNHSRIIAYYISNYGFGHATRSVPIIRELCEQPGIKVIICHSFANEFLSHSLHELTCVGKVSIRRVTNDIGYKLKPHSLSLDRDRLRIEYNRYISRLPELIQVETQFLKKNHVELVICDIPPVPFKAAHQLSIPSIGLSNFTWYTAYAQFLTEDIRQPFFDCYHHMDYFLALAGSREPSWGRRGNETFGFFARTPQRETVHRIKAVLNPDGNQTIVFFGLGMKIDVGDLASCKIWDSPNCVFIVSSNTEVDRSNIYKIPYDDTESQNYIAASDLVISKPGWGTIAEAVSFNKPLILITREIMQEDINTIAYLQKRKRCELVDWKDMSEFQITDELRKKIKEQISKDREKCSEEVVSSIVDEINLIME